MFDTEALYPRIARAIVRRLPISGAAVVAGAVVLTAGRLVASVQRRWPSLQGPARPLTAGERAILQLVLDDAVALDDLRIVDGRAGLFDLVPHPFTLGTTIYLKGRWSPGLLVHEAVHVWQYRTRGARYTVDALAAQARSGTARVGGAYDWRAELRRGRTRWRDLNAEAQAQFVQDLWDEGVLVVDGRVVRGGGAFFRAGDDRAAARFHDGPIDRSALARDAVAALRAGRPARVSPR
ncbi:hypothetical protein PHK61_11880 [Actinomycetospora lutea]|uniref:hypothetical protein n=1 Tax=Actinomycetospora lutea TaxID=663604 RepID=UPI0023658B08|nr:hypothetical protein [Actinomycetospora lutea]MDD7939114.1 hypothetical protein [Actinomycetospora lutea]